jgi:hypothetical protein
MEIFVDKSAPRIMRDARERLVRSLVLAGLGLLLFPPITSAQNQGSISVQSVSHQRITSLRAEKNTVSNQKINSQRVSGMRLSNSSRGSGSAATYPGSVGWNGTPGNTSFVIVEGSAHGRPVLPPRLENTFILQAEYLTPHPVDASRPFRIQKQDVRLPLPRNGEIFWLPNGGSIVAE